MEKPYKRLAQMRYPIVGARSSLWLGADHLLQIASSGYTENYRRFYYRDIQALLFQKTIYGKIVNGILGTIAGIFFAMNLPRYSFETWGADAFFFQMFFGSIGGFFFADAFD